VCHPNATAAAKAPIHIRVVTLAGKPTARFQHGSFVGGFTRRTARPRPNLSPPGPFFFGKLYHLGQIGADQVAAVVQLRYVPLWTVVF